MVTATELFPCKYLKACDLAGEPCTVRIQLAQLEHLKGLNGSEELKLVVYFAGAKKSLPLNRTNFNAVASICGDNSDDWAGHKIELYPTSVDMQGKLVDAIRIRKPPEPHLALASSRAAAPKPKPAAAADTSSRPAASKPKPAEEPETTLAADMDDEIPF